MRISMLAACVIALAMLAPAQTGEADPYGVSTVQAALQERMNGQVRISSIGKQVARLGDRVSIGLLKLLDRQDLTDNHVVSSYLPVIREAFTAPKLITFETDKKPKVTLFLLDYLRQKVLDQHVQDDVQQTENFVKSQTAE